MTEPLKIGVAGLGVMGRNHARVLAEMRDVNLVAAFDPDAPTAEAARAKRAETAARAAEAERDAWKDRALSAEAELERLKAASASSAVANQISATVRS